MDQITAYLLALLETAEKELGLFKLAIARTFMGLGWFAVGVTLLGAGFLLLSWTCFTALASVIGSVGAGLVVSLIILIGGGAFLWIGQKNLK